MSSPPQVKWRSIAPMRSVRGSAPVISHNNKIYVFGGTGVNIASPLSDVEMYDVAIDKWFSLPKIPRPRANHALVLVGDKIVLLGGYTLKGFPVTDVDVFDTKTEGWQLYPPLKSTSTMYPTVLTIEKDIYIFGGANHLGVAIPDCYVLEEEGGDWKAIPPLTVCRYHAKAFHFDNQVVIVGGRSGKDAVMSVDTYDLKEKKWLLKKCGPVVTKRVFSVPFQHKEFVYLINGILHPTYFKSNVECYNIKKRKWEIVASSTFARADCAVAKWNNYIVVASGMCEYGPNQVVEVFDLEAKQWHALSKMPVPRMYATSVVVGNQVFVLGGIGLKGATSEVDALTFH